jgi:hypothetical protein
VIAHSIIQGVATEAHLRLGGMAVSEDGRSRRHCHLQPPTLEGCSQSGLINYKTPVSSSHTHICPVAARKPCVRGESDIWRCERCIERGAPWMAVVSGAAWPEIRVCRVPLAEASAARGCCCKLLSSCCATATTAHRATTCASEPEAEVQKEATSHKPDEGGQGKANKHKNTINISKKLLESYAYYMRHKFRLGATKY